MTEQQLNELRIEFLDATKDEPYEDWYDNKHGIMCNYYTNALDGLSRYDKLCTDWICGTACNIDECKMLSENQDTIQRLNRLVSILHDIAYNIDPTLYE